jgi:hypothetical protein
MLLCVKTTGRANPMPCIVSIINKTAALNAFAPYAALRENCGRANPMPCIVSIVNKTATLSAFAPYAALRENYGCAKPNALHRVNRQ